MINSLLQDCKMLNSTSKDLNDGLCLSFSNLSIGEKALAIFNAKKQCVVVCKDYIFLQQLSDALSSLGLKVAAANIAANVPIYSHSEINYLNAENIATFLQFKNKQADVLLVLPESLLVKFPSIDVFDSFVFETNANVGFEFAKQKLLDLGYTKQEYATEKGTFAVRGDILDVFPTSSEMPIRLDFFGNTIEKICFFDVVDMKPYDTIKSFEILSASFAISASVKENLCKEIDLCAKEATCENKNNVSALAMQAINDVQLNITNKQFFYCFLNFKQTILTLFDCLVFVDTPKKIYEDCKNILENNTQSIQKFVKNGQLLNKHANHYNNIENIFDCKQIAVFDNFDFKNIVVDKNYAFRNVGTRNYINNFKLLAADLETYKKNNLCTVLFCKNEKNKQILCNFLLSLNIVFDFEYNSYSCDGKIIVCSLPFCQSASFLDSNFVFIGCNQLFKSEQKTIKSSRKTEVFYLPKVGEFIVHSIHGIGKCVKIEKLNFNGTEKDYFVIEYKGGDIFYLPSEQANTISAYVGSEEKIVLNKIGGQEFAKIKEKVKKSVATLAFDLVALYKARENAKGYVYSQNNSLAEFENDFPYPLTEDQAQAVADIKKDFYSSRVLDRLICGDVGYGKTEVALRAAFACVLEGKQVAFLCPTTILSQQHYETTKKRTQDYGCKVAVLNRFKTKSDQNQILKELKEGSVDIICGTHRLLSNDVVFKDLGLLILDEEHRFGVGDKEKIKNIKKSVDVLTLSATPIPRTLNMAMTGIRDISVIATPPKNRLAVQTYVTPQNDVLIEDSCKRELARGGQVLIVYNKVASIDEFASHIASLIPNARVGVAHGQLPERILEDRIFKLYNKEYDIFIATTLIENGIDLPLANTLIIIDADNLGLSQLYQLKGRIGRSDRLAYAYFTYKENKSLSEEAYKRLDAIMEFASLGSGFKIAMRDLEIRGAGNVLGKEQSGHLTKVGYDLYCKILQQEVETARGHKKTEKTAVKVDIFISAFLPQEYIENEEKRIEKYTQISNIETRAELEEIISSTQNAFGELPNSLNNLIKISYIKNLCANANIKRILCKDQQTVLYFCQKEDINSNILDCVEKHKSVATLKVADTASVHISTKQETDKQKLDFIIKFLEYCNKV